MQLRGGGSPDGAVVAWADLFVSMLVLLAVSMAAQSGSSLLAAAFSTAPTGVPLSLWLVHRAAVEARGDAALVAAFLGACIQGALALIGFCVGALACLQLTQTGLPSLGTILAAGYASWAASWALLRRIAINPNSSV